MAPHLWRAFFLLCAAGILTGGPLHPGGTIAEMLAHPDWFRAHALVLAGFVALTVGLVLYLRTQPLSGAARVASKAAIVGCVLQSIEMIFHTAAMVDHHNLVTGAPTPILTTHLWMTSILYPVFGLTMTAFIVSAASSRQLGGWWIAWLGIAGALAHGAAGPLVVIWNIEGARILFPMVMFLALWCTLAACWPGRLAAVSPTTATT
jgi:hypothetical protein